MDLNKQQKFTKRYRWHTMFFKAIDISLWPLRFLSKEPEQPFTPQKILIANAGHLGDLVISSAAIAAIEQKWPQAKIGLLCANSLKPLEQHLLGISQFHYLDHWYTDRSSASRWQKIKRYLINRKRVIGQIDAQNYDLAIDLRIWFPNFIPLLWRTNIRVRVGSTRVGFSPLLTNPVPFYFDGGHESSYQLEILNTLSPMDNIGKAVQPKLTALLPQDNLPLCQWLAAHNLLPNSAYRVIHMGSSNALRDWPIERWQELAAQLISQGHRIIFTGTGERERMSIQKVIANLPTAINACDALTLSQFMGLLGGAQLVYSVETSAGHLAAALGVPVVALYGGTADPDQWKPLGKVSVVTQRLACSPCYLQKGCPSMACIRDIEVTQVQEASQKLIQSI